MEIIQEKHLSTDVVKLKGRLDASTAPKLEDTLNALSAGDSPKILVDCKNLDYISSAGLRVLLSTAKQVKKNKGRISLSSLNPNVFQVFEISGFSSIFPIFSRFEDALEDLTQ